MKAIYPILIGLILSNLALAQTNQQVERIKFQKVTYDVFKINIKEKTINFHWKNDKGQIYRNFKNLKESIEIENQQLIFAINGGIYNHGNIPKGLYIENGKKISKVDTEKGKGNFYLEPNGIFLTYTGDSLDIIPSKNYTNKTDSSIVNALQSGPLLLNKGKVNSKFNKKSKNKHLRSGVGKVSATEVVFVISNAPVNLFTFSKLFKDVLHCETALYLDGAICKAYIPALNRKKLNGSFASMISVTEEKK